MKEVKISTEYIKLGQFLKFVAIIDSGAFAKTFLIENQVLVNGSRDDRRGRKLFDGDVVSVFDQQYLIKVIEE